MFFQRKIYKLSKVMLSHFLCSSSLSGSCRQVSLLTNHLSAMPNGYKEAIATLNKLQSNVEYIKYAKIRNNQENNMMEMKKFLNRSGMSLEQLDLLPVIHVAGTNGKGTTCSYCESILRNYGYKTGFYSSPHLLEVRERIRLNGMPISQEKFAEYFWRIFKRLDKEKSAPFDMPLYFRFITLMALHIFVAEKVDVAILEVGIGGEYDCTNIVRKTVVAGITPLDIDHTALLGNSLESIAWNKAGIIKPGAEVFTVPQPESALRVLKERSLERNCVLNVVEDCNSNHGHSKIPQHIQMTNSSLALALSKSFIKHSLAFAHYNPARPVYPVMCAVNFRPKTNKEFDVEVAKRSIESSKWVGRYEIIPRQNSVFYLDGAHTVDSMQVCSEWFLKNSKSGENHENVLIFNLTGERNPESLLTLLLKCQFSTVIFVPNVGDDNDNADSEDHIQTVVRQLERCHINKEIWTNIDSNAIVEVVPSFAKAVRFLENQHDRRFDVLVTGSLHLIGAALSVLDPTLGGIL